MFIKEERENVASTAAERGKRNVMKKSLAKHIGSSSFAKSYMKKKEKVVSNTLNNCLYNNDGHLKYYHKFYKILNHERPFTSSQVQLCNIYYETTNQRSKEK